MKKTRAFGVLLAIVMAVSLIPFHLLISNAEEGSPVIEKPVYVTVEDENGDPVSGTTVQVIDAGGNVVKTLENVDASFSVFLSAGTYTLKVSSAPSGYVPAEEIASITVEVTEAEERDDLPANTVYDGSHPEICVPLMPNVVSSHVGIERYTVYEPDGAVTAWCFNQNYDNPYTSAPPYKPDYDASEHHYKRLVGTPELLYNLAQYKSDTITPQELYDHVLAIMYLKDSVQQEYGFDDALMEFLVGRAIKTFTDPKAFLNSHTDDDGNTVVGQGTVWGAVINHAKRENDNIDLNAVHPEYREAYYKLIGKNEPVSHPDDYYLYIYYPENWESGNTDTDQCLLSAFTVSPVRTTLKVRQATSIEITKTWADENDQDGYRPTAEAYAAMVKLYADGTDVTETYKDGRTVTDNGDDTYTVKFTDLPKMSGDQEIAYKIKETNVSKYTADNAEAADGGTITNRHEPDKISIPVTKEWQDAENADGVRPKSITVHLLADDSEVKSETITPDSDGNWSYTFKDLPKFRDHGVEIVYTITEDPVPEYDTVIDAYTITNKHSQETTDVSVTKEWKDNENAKGVRPESITVRLLADGTEVKNARITPDEEGNWSYTFEKLPKNKAGKEIVYTIAEDPVPEYEAVIENYHITNTYVPTIEFPVKKVWDDANDQDGIRPDSITVNLLADGTVVETVKISPDENGDWSYTFKGLKELNSDGSKIEYSVEEEAVPDYETSIENGTITNKHTPEKICVEGKKTWDDDNNRDKMRPASITIRLFADGGEAASLTVTEKDGWKWSFTDLPKCKDGKPIKYEIREDDVKGYTSTVNGFDVTNSYAPPTGDPEQPAAWIALLALSLLACIAMMLLERMYVKNS